MMAGWKIGGAAVAVAALAVGGYFANEHFACSALEEDYLNGVSKLKSSAQLNAIDGLVGNVELGEVADRSEQEAVAEMSAAQLAIRTRCGERASDSAFRKGQDMLSSF